MRNTDIMFMATVHNCAGIQENVYGFTRDQVIELVKELKKSNNDFRIAHIYSPIDGSKRNYIGYEML